MPLHRKRRSQSQSSSDENEIKKIKDEVNDMEYYNEINNDIKFLTSFKKSDKKPKKSEVILLDCKKLDSTEMLLMFNPMSNRWNSLPMPDVSSHNKVNPDNNKEELGKCFCAKNIIGFMQSNIIFWKDHETLVALNTTSYVIKTIPSMTVGKPSSTSTWRYFCAMNRLIAVNIFSRGESDSENSMYENAVVNIMTYDFREGGWEKRAEHHFEKLKESIPHTVYIENKDGFWLCISDQYLNNNYKVEKHKLHLLFIENFSWGLEEIDCSEVSTSYCESNHFLSLAIDASGDISIITKPYIYKYDSLLGTWDCQICSEPLGTDAILSDTISVQGVRKYYFKMADGACDFCVDNLETGMTKELEIPPLYIYKKSAQRHSSQMKTNRHRITNTIESGKLAAFLVGDAVMKQIVNAAWNKFECEF